MKEKISEKSKVMYVNDGSKDNTWEIIKKISKEEKMFTGITLSRNRGHQNALLGGLMTAKKYADVFYQASTLDVAAITDIAVKEKVNFLITACTDQALLTVAKVSEDLGLPCYIDYQTALNVTNKAYMKKVFEEHGISTALRLIKISAEVRLISLPFLLLSR